MQITHLLFDWCAMKKTRRQRNNVFTATDKTGRSKHEEIPREVRQSRSQVASRLGRFGARMMVMQLWDLCQHISAYNIKQELTGWCRLWCHMLLYVVWWYTQLRGSLVFETRVPWYEERFSYNHEQEHWWEIVRTKNPQQLVDSSSVWLMFGYAWNFGAHQQYS